MSKLYVVFTRRCSKLEQAVAGADIPLAIRLENDGWKRAADARIDHAEKDGARRKPRGIGRQQVGRCPAIADRRVGEKVDHGYAGRHLVQHRSHLPDIGTMQSEIREQHNHRAG
jgi:hypothetical protein